jgi:hypothetical protein
LLAQPFDEVRRILGQANPDFVTIQLKNSTSFRHGINQARRVHIRTSIIADSVADWASTSDV